jgi:hypothetical protein
MAAFLAFARMLIERPPESDHQDGSVPQTNWGLSRQDIRHKSHIHQDQLMQDGGHNHYRIRKKDR